MIYMTDEISKYFASGFGIALRTLTSVSPVDTPTTYAIPPKSTPKSLRIQGNAMERYYTLSYCI